MAGSMVLEAHCAAQDEPELKRKKKMKRSAHTEISVAHQWEAVLDKSWLRAKIKKQKQRPDLNIQLLMKPHNATQHVLSTLSTRKGIEIPIINRATVTSEDAALAKQFMCLDWDTPTVEWWLDV